MTLTQHSATSVLGPGGSFPTEAGADSQRRNGLDYYFLRLPGYLVDEARLPILLIFTVRMVAATGIVAQFSADRVKITVAWVMLTMAVYVFNGISDVAGDRVNGSTRPLASGRLSVRTASVSCLVLAVASLALAWSCGVVAGLLAGAALLLGWAYSAGPDLKRTPLGLAVTIFGGASLTYTAGRQEAPASIGIDLALLGVALWVSLAAFAKDFSDIDGDRATGRRTLPVVLGAARAGRLAAVLATAGFLVVAATIWIGARSISPVIVVLGIGTAALAVLFLRVRPEQSRQRRRLPYKSFALTQIAVNMVVIVCTA